jgi:hypothetical protein
MDVTNRRDLDASLAAWKRDLERDRAKYKAHRTDALLRQVQMGKAMVVRRQRQLARLPGPRRTAVTHALARVGTVEHPAGSNTGPGIDTWQARFGIHGQPWCGAFVGSMVNEAGAHVSARIVYTPYIYADAAAGKNGLERVVWKDTFVHGLAHTGDLVLFDFGSGGIKHVGMLRKPWTGNGPLFTVEGNTSFGNGGSQDNGGAVALRERDVSLVHSIVRVKWPA